MNKRGIFYSTKEGRTIKILEGKVTFLDFNEEAPRWTPEAKAEFLQQLSHGIRLCKDHGADTALRLIFENEALINDELRLDQWRTLMIAYELTKSDFELTI